MKWSAAERLGPFVYFVNNWVSLLGVVLVTTAGVAWLFSLPAFLGAGEANPYSDLLTVFGLPLLFFAGLALIPAGIFWRRKRESSLGRVPAHFPAVDWNNPAFRRLAGFVLVATMANVLIGGTLTYSAVEYMDSTSFCGASCHIMEPEFTAYQVSPHAEVGCTECHIGAGAGSFVQAKLNGTRQLIAVLTNTYPTPVPTPVHNLAQGALTCGECHSNLDLGSKRVEWNSYAADENNSATRTELVLHIGGGENPAGAHGAHMADGAFVEYRSNSDRSDFPWMRYVSPEGEETVYAKPSWSEADADDYELRRMDCVDCHNRAAHSFERADRAIDQAMAAGTVSPELPFIKREGLEAVRTAYETREEAAREIPRRIQAFYQDNYPEIAAAQAAEVENAGVTLAAIYARNIFPEFAVSWGVHPNHLGHTEKEPGCLRCHNDDLIRQDADAAPLGDECAACHLVVAEDEPLVPETQPDVVLTSAEDLSRRPETLQFAFPAGGVLFGHEMHIRLQNGRCDTCHNRLFPMEEGAPLNYAGDLHRTAEARQTSCASCHRPQGPAFGAQGSCTRCHTGLSEPTEEDQIAESTGLALPVRIAYRTSLGVAAFDHARHLDRTGACQECHNRLFLMARGELDYGGRDLHQSAEAAGASCAGCHAAGRNAFEAADNCTRCHLQLGRPRRTPETVSGIPAIPTLTTRLGPARFDHDRHADLLDGDCTGCHNQVFPLERGLLNYADNLHQTAEAEQTSCGACHRPEGSAFASKGNCLECHADMTAQAAGSALGMPARVVFANRLADVPFSHDDHIRQANGDCSVCHPQPFAMQDAALEDYAQDYHRKAEQEKTSCASCHAPGGEAFGSLNNCTRCHVDLELPRKASAAGGVSGWLVLLLVAVPAGLFGQSRGQGFIGSERCAVCHSEVSEGFAANPHAALATSKRWEMQQVACEACHGPGLAHVQALAPEPLRVFAEAQPDRVNQACQDCHGGDKSQSGFFFSSHQRNEIACTGCHQVHEAQVRPLLASAVDSLCAGCHTAAAVDFNRPFSHKLRQGGVSCVDCHHPHGSPRQASLARFGATETACFECHPDKQGPFPFEHAPMRLGDCTECHEPHGSSNPRMMTRHNVAQLCLECHTTTLMALGGSPPAFHDVRSARFRACTVCHSKIHGSFVSQDFLR